MLLVALIFHLPPFQSYLLEKTTTFFNERTGGDLKLESIDIRIPYYVRIEGLTLSRPTGDHLLSAENIEVKLGWRNLFNRTISLNDIYLKNIDGKLVADKDGNWNYQFIVDGFKADSDTTETSTKSAPWDLTTSDIRLSNVDFDYLNGHTRDTLNITLGHFHGNFQRVSINNLTFLADQLELSTSFVYYAHYPSEP